MNNLIISNLSIIAVIVYFIINAILYFVHNLDYNININFDNNKTKIILSCRTIYTERAIDLSIFLISQLYSNIRYGLNGIEIIGYVNIIWCNKPNNNDIDMQLLREHKPQIT